MVLAALVCRRGRARTNACRSTAAVSARDFGSADLALHTVDPNDGPPQESRMPLAASSLTSERELRLSNVRRR